MDEKIELVDLLCAACIDISEPELSWVFSFNFDVNCKNKLHIFLNQAE